MSKETPTPRNTIANREQWQLEYRRRWDLVFAKKEAALPEKIRFGTGGGKNGFRGKGLSVSYAPLHSADDTWEVTVLLSVAEARFVGRELLRQLVAISARYNGLNHLELAHNIGFKGPKRDLVMKAELSDMNDDICTTLGPYPGAVLSLPGMSINEALEPIGEKKQTTRMLKSECSGSTEGLPCGYTLRVAAKWARLGVLCPVHGAMQVTIPNTDEADPTAKAAE